MLKFTRLLLFFCILSTTLKLNAQQKVAFIDYTALLLSMPETKEAEIEFNKYIERWNNMYTSQVKEYMLKDSLFKKDSTKWLPAIKTIKKKELEQLAMRVTSLSESSKEESDYQNAKLMEPIHKRASTAIEAVVKENGFTKWVDKTELAKYAGAKDILALVKKKLANTPNLTTKIKFDNRVFNLGNLEEKEIIYNIKYTNIGKAPLNISNVSSSTNCIKLEWPQKAIKSGDSGIIKVIYDGTNCQGSFNQSLKVISNTNESPEYLEIRGYVGNYLKNQLSEQFLKIMLAFPSNFESLKNGLSNVASGEYYSKVKIEDSKKTAIVKGKANKNSISSLIGSFDSKEKSLQKYQELIKIINAIKLNGAALKVYKTEQNESLTSTKWRLDNSKNNINKEYQPFTIELTCIYMGSKISGVSINFGDD